MGENHNYLSGDNPGHFEDLVGTSLNHFHFWGPDGAAIGAKGKTGDNADILQILKQNCTDLGWMETGSIADKAVPTVDQLITWFNTMSIHPNILGGFVGTSPPASGNGFYICTASGGSYTQNEIYYFGFGTGSMVVRVYKSLGGSMQSSDNASNGGTLTHITTTSSVTIDTVTLLADALYAWEYKASAWRWVLKGFAGAGDDCKLIRFPVGYVDTASTTPIPTGHLVTRVTIAVDTAYNTGATLAISVGADTIMSNLHSDIEHIGMYVRSTPQAITGGDVVTADFTGATSGAGYVEVEFGKIFP